LQITNLSANADSYSWSFGNGDIVTSKTPMYFYPLHGDYKLTLTVTSPDGQTASSSYDLQIWCSRGSSHSPVTQPD
jgi:PKD repeat protein